MSLFDRTLHPDEANQAFTTGKLLETGVYQYRPTDHHGPTLYYAAAPLQQAGGHTQTADLDPTALRCTPLVFAVAGLVLLFCAVRWLLKRGTKPSTGGSWLLPLLPVALLGTAPLYVFYATDFIQEMLLVCFTLLMFATGVGYFLPGTRLKRGTWALFFGTGAGLAFATKETCVLTFAAFAGAALPFLIADYRRTRRLPFRVNDCVLAFMGFLITAVILFSSLGRDFTGVYNAFVAAPLSYVHRAAGDVASEGAAWHVHPWWQHLQWLFLGNAWGPDKNGTVWHQFTNLKPLLHWVLLLLPCGLVAAFGARREKMNRPLVRAFLGTSLACALLLVFYSAIPYKTPWCTLQILVPYLVSVGLGYLVAFDVLAERLADKGPKIRAVLAFALFFCLPMGVMLEHAPGLKLMVTDPDSSHIPYNYAHSSPEVKQLAACVAQAVAEASKPLIGPVNPQLKAARANPPFIAVALPSTDTWPFPFYNRKLEGITGYWTKFDDLVALQQSGAKPTVVIVQMTEGHLAQALFPELKHTKRFYIRPGVRVRVFW